MGLGPIPNLGPMSPNSGLFPYSPAEAVPVQVPNTVDCGPAGVFKPGPKFFLSFQLLLAQPLVVYHARSAWFLLLQQRTNKHEALPFGCFPHGDSANLFGFGHDVSAILFGFGHGDSATLFGFDHGDSATLFRFGHDDSAMVIRPPYSDSAMVIRPSHSDDSATIRIRPSHSDDSTTIRIRP